MTIYSKNIQIIIKDRSYSDWYFVDYETKQKLSIDDYPELNSIIPSEQKLFNMDVVYLDNSNININVINKNSYIKTVPYLSGILILDNNKTYGRTPNKKRLLYKCIPDDPGLPSFLIPYDIKIGFSKIIKNRYIIFKYENWEGKHPNGMIIETIGDVDNLEAFYDYKLYCSYLHISISEFTNKTRFTIGNKPAQTYVNEILNNPNYNIEDRRNDYVFTIDSATTVDYDDAFGIKKVGNKWVVSVYISNIFLWIETMDLWDSFSKRVATVYLPDRNRTMLPPILSDNLCSLKSFHPSFALAMDFIIDENSCINNISYKNVLIQVNKNYSYDDASMYIDNQYIMLYNVSKNLDYSIQNSHDLVSFWMVKMNSYTGTKLSEYKTGIFKTIHLNNSILRHDINNGNEMSENTFQLIRNWNNSTGKYLLYDLDNKKSELPKYYAHVTSPIRRMVDFLNHIILLKEFKLLDNMSEKSQMFLKFWLSELDYLNSAMHSIRKIQLECDLVNKCFNEPSIMDNTFQGTVFSKEIKSNEKITYMVYLEKIKLLSKITTSNDLSNYSKHNFKIYLFEDEDKVRKKIRLQIII
uniref:RNB domain-containing protein n=1 Tax=viral metagenome TaxID=1070528 RepID=A0A6C0DC52_9ZZZZ